MASLRGGQVLWSEASVSDGDSSALANIGPGPYVAVYISNSGANAATFDVEASVQLGPEAGRNALDGTDDGGLTWFPYQGASGTEALVVSAGETICFDLAPFSPQFIRLLRTDSGTATTISAYVSAFGPN